MTKEIVIFDQLTTKGVQTRVEVNKGVVKNYAKLMKDGTEFPAIVVFRGWDQSGFMVDLLVDGYTRLEAMKLNNLVSCTAEVTEFTQGEDVYSEAILANIRLNSKSGFAMTTADKKNAVLILLGRFPTWSDRAIGAECGVDHKTVGKYRKAVAEELHREATGEPAPTKKEVTKKPTAKELQEYIEKLKQDNDAINDRWIYAESMNNKLSREIERLEKVVAGQSNSESRLSNNSVKKLMKALHPDNFIAIQEGFPTEFKKIELAMKIVTNDHNGGK